jgi:hypothetical protein
VPEGLEGCEREDCGAAGFLTEGSGAVAGGGAGAVAGDLFGGDMVDRAGFAEAVLAVL